jgi:hypothetical protein
VTLFSEVLNGHSPAAYLLRNSAYGTAFPRNTNIGETFRMLPGYSVSGLERGTPRICKHTYRELSGSLVETFPIDTFPSRGRPGSVSVRSARLSKYATPSVASISRSVKRSVLGRTSDFPAISPVTVHSMNSNLAPPPSDLISISGLESATLAPCSNQAIQYGVRGARNPGGNLHY